MVLYVYFKRNWYTFKGSNCQKYFVPLWKGSTLKGTHWFLLIAFLPIRIEPFSDGDTYTRQSQKLSHLHITKTCLYNVDPLKPHFHTVELGFTGVNINFLILLQNIYCGYSLEPSRRGGSNEYHNLYFEQNYEKYQNVYLKSFIFGGNIFSICE